jgi:molecular chaperone GrpE
VKKTYTLDIYACLSTSHREPTSREDKNIRKKREIHKLMAQKKNIVIEEENGSATQESTKTPSDVELAEDEPKGDEESIQEEDPINALEEELAAAQAEASEYRDRMLRMAAELDNYKKRSSRELDDLKKYATENLIRQLLTVVDNLERAIASASPENQNGKSVVDGVALTLAEIMKILEKQNVSVIDSLGEPFDPAFHQAMCQEERLDKPPNTVVQEFQKGYLIHDRLLRPAMVVVSKAAPDGQAKENAVDTNA